MSNQTIGALTGTAGGTNVPLADISSSLTEPVLLGRAAGASTPFATIPFSALPGAATEFDFILRNRADLVAIVAPVGGVFVLPAGSYFLKTSFALNAGEGLQVNNTSVFIMGGGWGKMLTGGAVGVPLVQVTGANGRCQLLSLTLNAAVGNAKCLEAGGEVSVATQVVFQQLAASATEPAVDVTGTGRLTLDTCRVAAVNRCVRNATNQRLTAANCRVESEQGPAVDITGANGWSLFSGGIVRTTVGLTGGGCFSVNGAAANLFVEETEVSTVTTATILNVGAAGAGAINIIGGEWQTGNAAGTTGISINGPITKELSVQNVAVQNCAVWVAHVSGTVATAEVCDCVGSAGVTTCVSWNVANIPTRGIRELGNSWNGASANVFLLHQQNDARVSRRSNHSSTAPLSETGIVP